MKQARANALVAPAGTIHFLAKTAVDSGLPLKQLSPAALAVLQSYSWPGNVRELQNMIERAVVFTESDILGAEAFPQILEGTADELFAPPFEEPSLDGQRADPPFAQLRDPQPEQANPYESVTSFDGVSGEWPTLAGLEANHIRKTLEETFFNQSAAARLLGVDRKLLARKMKRYGIVAPRSHTQQAPSKSK